MSTLKPVGHQFTNWMVCLVLMFAMAEVTFWGTTCIQLHLLYHRDIHELNTPMLLFNLNNRLNTMHASLARKLQFPFTF